MKFFLNFGDVYNCLLFFINFEIVHKQAVFYDEKWLFSLIINSFHIKLANQLDSTEPLGPKLSS